MTKQTPRVEIGRIELIVDYEGKDLAFVHPLQGPNDYQTVGKGILARNLTIPTGSQIASLIQGAYSSEEPEFKEVQNIMRNKWLWVFNRNLWTPEGVYVVNDPEVIGMSQPLDVDNLRSKLIVEDVYGIRASEDGNIRFAPKDSYRLGEHTKESLTDDSFMIASFGKAGAEVLADFSTKFRYKPAVWGVDVQEGQDNVQRVSALNSGRGLNSRLYVDGGSHGGRGGCAFGV
ncbi:MAG: hypothetical protein KKH88_01555 [Nanoarchaeota archaeon]|nr:hypothetical protein [Nanoarchaeota archaeon]